jgi:RNA-binding protein
MLEERLVMKLNNAQKRHLRSLGHHLDPVVQLGKKGVTEGLTEATDVALTTHELIKIKCGSECPVSREEVGEQLSQQLKASLVQTLGGTILLYRRHPQKPKIKLPRA